MAKSVVALGCFLACYHSVADARRLMKQKARSNAYASQKGLQKEKAESEESWCNPFSLMRTKVYKLDVLDKGENCVEGFCTAYEFVRHKTNPTLNVHYNQSWAVKYASDEDDDPDDLVWDLVQANPNAASAEKEFAIMDAELVTFGEEREDKAAREYVRFDWGNGEYTKIAGGLFYKGGMVRRGMEKQIMGWYGMEPDNETDHEMPDELGEDGEFGRARQAYELGTKDAHKKVAVNEGVAGAQNGGSLGGQIGAYSAYGGLIFASQVMKVALTTSTVVGVSLGGIFGGAAIGALIGGAVYTAEILQLMKDKGISGADKLWEKLWCLDFDVCQRNVYFDGQYVTTMVPRGKQCPEPIAPNDVAYMS